ncbi:hypothetical protein, partial [Serratia sp. CY60142]
MSQPALSTQIQALET